MKDYPSHYRVFPILMEKLGQAMPDTMQGFMPLHAAGSFEEVFETIGNAVPLGGGPSGIY